MEATVLRTAAKVAGLAGLSLGVLLLIFLAVLKAGFIPVGGLTSELAFSALYTLIILTFGAAAIGLVGWLISPTSPGTPVPGRSLALLVFLIIAFLIAVIYARPAGQPGPPKLVMKSFTHPDIPGKDGDGNNVSSVSKISVVVMEQMKTATEKQTRVVVKYGFYNGSGTWRGGQALSLQLNDVKGAVLKQISSPIDRGKCVYGGPEDRGFETVVENIAPLVEGIDMSVSRVTGVQTRC